jgi:hypothetical protein
MKRLASGKIEGKEGVEQLNEIGGQVLVRQEHKDLENARLG